MLHAGQLFKTPATPTAPPVPDWPAYLATLASSARDPRLRQYYRAGCPPGSTPLDQVPLVALDVETTGLDPARDGIVSLGLVPFTLQRIRASQARHWLLKPRVDLVDASVAYHGITHSQLADAPDLEDVLAELLALLAGQVVVVHCNAVERGFMNGALQRRLGEDIAFPVIDTMALEAQVRTPASAPAPRSWWPRRPRAAPAAQSLRLAACRERYQLPRYTLHHALSDALGTAELLLAQVAHHHRPDTPLQALWC